jgi:DNA-binding FrmR family transcriptional regulator
MKRATAVAGHLSSVNKMIDDEGRLRMKRATAVAAHLSLVNKISAKLAARICEDGGKVNEKGG